MTPPDPLASSAGPLDTPAIVTPAPAEVAITPAAEQTIESAPIETPGEKPKSLLDLVKSVVEAEPADVVSPTTKAAESAPDPASPDAKVVVPPASAEPDPAAAKGEESDEELPFHKHPRFQALVREKNANAADAKEFRAIGAYMSEQNLSADEVDTGFAIMAAIKNDPRKALEMLAPTIQALQLAAGETLSPEVAKLVEDGEMTEAAALELSRTRADLALQTERTKQTAEQSRNHAAAQSHQHIVDAVTTWEAKVAASNPDYAALKAIVFTNIRLANLTTPATTPAEALAIADAALKAAKESVKGFTPSRPEVKAPTAALSATKATTAPRSLADVIRAAVA